MRITCTSLFLAVPILLRSAVATITITACDTQECNSRCLSCIDVPNDSCCSPPNLRGLWEGVRTSAPPASSIFVFPEENCGGGSRSVYDPTGNGCSIGYTFRSVRVDVKGRISSGQDEVGGESHCRQADHYTLIESEVSHHLHMESEHGRVYEALRDQADKKAYIMMHGRQEVLAASLSDGSRGL